MKKASEPAQLWGFCFCAVCVPKLPSQSSRSLRSVSIGVRGVPPLCPFKYFRIDTGNRGQPFLCFIRTKMQIKDLPADDRAHLNWFK